MHFRSYQRLLFVCTVVNMASAFTTTGIKSGNDIASVFDSAQKQSHHTLSAFGVGAQLPSTSTFIDPRALMEQDWSFFSKTKQQSSSNRIKSDVSPKGLESEIAKKQITQQLCPAAIVALSSTSITSLGVVELLTQQEQQRVRNRSKDTINPKHVVLAAAAASAVLCCGMNWVDLVDTSKQVLNTLFTDSGNIGKKAITVL